MTRLAFDLSEQFDTMVIVRGTTRLSHTRSPVAIGPRTDIDLGASLEITKGWLFWTIGFKMRTYQLEVDGVAYAEQLNSTYSGLKLAWDF